LRPYRELNWAIREILALIRESALARVFGICPCRQIRFFRRDVGDGEHAEIVIAERVYRVRTKEFA